MKDTILRFVWVCGYAFLVRGFAMLRRIESKTSSAGGPGLVAMILFCGGCLTG